MSKMSRQDRQAYEQALKRRKKQSSPGKRQRTAYSRTSKSSTAGRSRSRYTDYDGNEIDESYINNRRNSRYTGYNTYDRYSGYDDYDYDDYDDYDDDYDYEERPGRTRMPEDLGFGYRREKSSSKRRRPEDSYPVSGKRSRKQNGKLILLIQLIATALFLASAVYLGMIPWLYLGAAAIVLLILVLLVYRMQNGFRKKRFLGALLGLLISAVLLVAAFYMFEVRSALNDITDGNEAPELSEAAAAVNVSEDPFSVYISGIDVYGDITQQSRSDVNIIATVNPKTKQILLVTTPRDYYVPIPGVSEGYPDKLTHAGTYGIATSMATLEELYDVDIPFYVRVNFTSLIEMVDTLGGIDVESDIAFTTGEESGLVVEVKEGTNHFNGQEALAFCRERHALAEGDNQRGKNQQAVIEAMLKKAMSPSILIKGPRLIDQVSGNTETNMSTSQLQELVRVQLAGMNGWDVVSVAAEGTSSTEYCYSYSGGPLSVIVPDDSSVASIQEKINAVEAGETVSE